MVGGDGAAGSALVVDGPAQLSSSLNVDSLMSVGGDTHLKHERPAQFQEQR